MTEFLYGGRYVPISKEDDTVYVHLIGSIINNKQGVFVNTTTELPEDINYSYLKPEFAYNEYVELSMSEDFEESTFGFFVADVATITGCTEPFPIIAVDENSGLVEQFVFVRRIT
jgi:hypothetical protein